MTNAAFMVAALASVVGATCCSPKAQSNAGGHGQAATTSEQDHAQVAKSWRTTEFNPSKLMAWSVPLPPVSVTDVSAASLSGAVELLGKKEWLALSTEEAEAMAGSRLDRAGKHYLLRGVEMAHGEDPLADQDKLKVFDIDGVVTVRVMGNRLDRLELRPRPVIAMLPAEPKRLFVEPRYSFSMRASDMESALKRGH